MKRLIGICIGLVLGIASVIGVTVSSRAASIPASAAIQLDRETAQAGEHDAEIIKIGHRKRVRSKGRKFKRRSYRRHHRKFHKRYHPRRKHYRKAHKRFHRHYRRRHSRPKIRIDWNRGYYDPYHYTPRYYDPFYYGPPYRSRLSCNHARRIVRRHGYHRVRSYDCRGKVYGFIGIFKGKRYKVRVSAYSGAILSRRRY